VDVVSGPYFDEANHDDEDAARHHRERRRVLEVVQEGTSQEKRRHHFVPRMWLRNWADHETDRIEVADVDELKNFSAGAGNVMLVTDLYRAGAEAAVGYDMGPEEAFAQIEGDAARAMKKLLAGETLTDDERYDLSVLIALQHLRVPHAVAVTVPDDPSGTREAVEAFANAMLAEPDGAPPAMFEESARGRSSHELARIALDGYDEFAGVQRGFAFWALLDAAHELAARIHRRQWTVLKTESILFLSDDPVPVPPLGSTTIKAKGKTVAYDTPVPLGPHTVLLIGDRPDGAGEVAQDEATRHAAVSNEIQFNRVRRFLVGPSLPKKK
jgi:hypothetical protein